MRSIFVLTSAGIILTYLAIAPAVGAWSPVTIMTLIPADLHLLTAQGTDSLGGSISEISPTKVNSFKGKLNFSGLLRSNNFPKGNYSLNKCNLANPKTLSPFFPNLKLTCSNFFFHNSSICLTPPLYNT